MKLNTYLSFNGDTRQAFEYYAKHLGGNIIAMTTFGETPACESLPDSKDLIMHAMIDIGGHLVMGTGTKASRARMSSSTPRIRPKRTSCSRRWPTAARSCCRSRKRSGPSATASWPIASACLGWSTAPRSDRSGSCFGCSHGTASRNWNRRHRAGIRMRSAANDIRRSANPSRSVTAARPARPMRSDPPLRPWTSASRLARTSRSLATIGACAAGTMMV